MPEDTPLPFKAQTCTHIPLAKMGSNGHAQVQGRLGNVGPSPGRKRLAQIQSSIILRQNE